MAKLPSSLTNSRLLPPESIWLEPEQMEQAKVMSASTSIRLCEGAIPETQEWQCYLNALALLGFEQWFSERLPEYSLERTTTLHEARSDNPIESACYVQVNGFTFCLLTVEHVLDETVYMPQAVVEQPHLAAHFYVVHEVSEEQALVTIRGFLRFDELIDYHDRYNCQPQNGFYQLPLAVLDAEPNHLLFYCRSLQPAAIPLQVGAAVPSTNRLLGALTNTTTTLTQWFQNAFDEHWHTIDQLINADAYLALSTRSIESGAQRGKLINLGVQLGQLTVALLVNVTAEADGKLGVLVQLHPTGEARSLMPKLKLSLRSVTGNPLQEVTSRSQDNYIQLKPFKVNLEPASVLPFSLAAKRLRKTLSCRSGDECEQITTVGE